ncbi:hypothetical protein [Vreelandella profundi]|uniref:hypothetical protein n=1 Tax=Vreelandella profundi TaxID=2852117 RepID=UPI001F317045|nr:hypothetical protein [Halomonas profundi]
MNYESWRISFQSSEQAARAAFQQLEASNTARDSLAALFVKLQDAATDLIHASNEEEAGDAMELIAECSEEEALKILASRDAAQREKGLRETAKWFAALHTSSELLSAEVVYDILIDQARRQAEGHQ